MESSVKTADRYPKEERVVALEKVEKSLSTTVYLSTKRTFDIFCGVMGVIVLIPLSIIIKFISIISGDFNSIFYIQKRIGKDGKEFNLYKFRSMVTNSDEILKELLKDEKYQKEWEEHHKFENDPRITPVGKILRKTSLDEMPQLINVLLGDMSLIGNRPYLVREKEEMGDYYNDIVRTRPGLTGYWQVEGRSETSFQERLELEKYYSHNACFKFDFIIFFKTFAAVLFSKGAK